MSPNAGNGRAGMNFAIQKAASSLKKFVKKYGMQPIVAVLLENEVEGF